MMRLQRWFNRLWYTHHPLRWLFWPWSQCYKLVMAMRRVGLRAFWQKRFPVPIIVVGNLTVGGTGKTPLIIALAQAIKAKNLRVGIVSRGYRAQCATFPYLVSTTDKALYVGDEPLLLAQKTGCPVVIAPDRCAAVHYLLSHHALDVVLSDDGLQHYALGRAVEMVVIDGKRKLGNGLCLPAGPLRESARRLKSCDFVIVNQGAWPTLSYPMSLVPNGFVHIQSGRHLPLHTLQGSVAAVAGIGHPERFFDTLSGIGVLYQPYSFPDHHRFQANEFAFKEETIVMTEKDAVKCHTFAQNSWYALSVEAKLSASFWKAFWSHKHLQGLIAHEDV